MPRTTICHCPVPSRVHWWSAGEHGGWSVPHTRYVSHLNKPLTTELTLLLQHPLPRSPPFPPLSNHSTFASSTTLSESALTSLSLSRSRRQGSARGLPSSGTLMSGTELLSTHSNLEQTSTLLPLSSAQGCQRRRSLLSWGSYEASQRINKTQILPSRPTVMFMMHGWRHLIWSLRYVVNIV
jgi:hypothetical protein